MAVFAASNFPFAFSVAGGDTASALAAGCPVVVKAHEGHPVTSDVTAEIVTGALAAAGAPAGTFALVHGVQAGLRLLRHPDIAAAGFTGSTAGGLALARICAERGRCRSRSTVSSARSTRVWCCPAPPLPARPRSPPGTPDR